MEQTILVNHRSLETMIVEMRQHVGAMRGRIDQLMRDLAPLREEFDGEARAAHAQVQAQVNRHFAHLGEVLSTTAVAVHDAQLSYGEADARAARRFRDVSL